MQTKERARGGGSLVMQVGESLRRAITTGKYRPGERLPSEIELTETHGVSRTVVREAVAALRSDGLVEVRQGAGIFVVVPEAAGVSAGRVESARVYSDLEVLEVRTPLEIEAAGLAALRRSPAQEEAIFRCHGQVLTCIESGQTIRDADRQLNLAIADATNNPLFRQSLDAHGTAIIPQSRVVPETDKAEQDAYRRKIHGEHAAIVMAISDANEESARTAMRDHLQGSQSRYRTLLRDLRSPRS